MSKRCTSWGTSVVETSVVISGVLIFYSLWNQVKSIKRSENLFQSRFKVKTDVGENPSF